jgi:hypothetical protein
LISNAREAIDNPTLRLELFMSFKAGDTTLPEPVAGGETK